MKSSRGFKVRGPLIWTLKSFEAGAGLTFSTNKLNWNVRVDVSSVVGVSRIVDLTRGGKTAFLPRGSRWFCYRREKTTRKAIMCIPPLNPPPLLGTPGGKTV